MERRKIIIPAGLQFADLALERQPISKGLLYNPEPLAKLFIANELALEKLVDGEDVLCWLVAEWYLAHRTAGGEPDPVAEEILAEVAALPATDIPALRPGGDRTH